MNHLAAWIGDGIIREQNKPILAAVPGPLKAAPELVTMVPKSGFATFDRAAGLAIAVEHDAAHGRRA
jgi:hypothetical protein